MKTFLKAFSLVLALTTSVVAAPINQGPIYIYQPLGGSSGGGGTGCIPAGAAGNILTDTGAGACGSDNSATLLSGALSLGSSGVAGSITLGNATSGTITLGPISGALGTVTLSLPAATDTLVGKATTDTFTNKSISGSTNTLTNIGNSSLTNSSVTVGSTNIALGATSTSLAGLTSVTSTSFVGALTGNASTATTATNATNGATVATSANASFFPIFAASSTNSNQPFNLNSGLSFNPSTATFTATTFVGALTGTASGNLTASNVATLTNKTFDTAAAGNSLSINGVAVTANTGTGAIVRATSPSLITPALGVATATSLAIGGTLGSDVLEITGTSTFNGSSSTLGQVNVQSGTFSLTGGILLGADANATTRTDVTTHQGLVGGANYTNANNPIEIMGYQSTSTANNIFFGGGNSGTIAATNIRFVTAPNNNTAGSSARTVLTIDTNFHIAWSGSATVPTVSSCGTSPSAVTGSDNAMTLTVGTGTTSCAVNYTTAYGSAPRCWANDRTNPVALKCNPGTGTVTVTGLTTIAGDIIDIFTVGN